MTFHYPIVGIPVDVKKIDGSPYHVVGEKYINAVANGAGCFPILIPAFGEGSQLTSLADKYTLEKVVDGLDGIFLPGSVSNIHPSHYQQEMQTKDLPTDAQRDETSLSLVRIALQKEIPLFAICRGFQEMNVALGGSLYQKVQEIDGYIDHREDNTLDQVGQYSKAHDISIVANGLLEKIYQQSSASVNSLHGQGIKDLAASLQVEAYAPDGLIEAFSVKDAKGFALGVQWHPEWQFEKDRLSTSMFQAFGDAVKRYKRQRNQ